MKTKSTTRLEATVGELQRCNELLRLLTDDLAELLEELSDKVTTKWVVNVLQAMLENLRTQSDKEEESDYFAEVLNQYPNWHPQIEHLRQQHSLLYKQLEEIYLRIAKNPEDSEVLFEVRRQLGDWIKTYNEHEARERRLLQDAFLLELGAGD